jgi:hypothetical protein
MGRAAYTPALRCLPRRAHRRTPRLHGFVRECVGQQLRGHPDWYAAYVPDDFSHYCASMARPGTWGDHVTLQVGRLGRQGKTGSRRGKAGSTQGKPPRQ